MATTDHISPIESFVEYPVIDFGNPKLRKRLTRCDVWLTNIEGEVSLKVYWRPDGVQKWTLWDETNHCAKVTDSSATVPHVWKNLLPEQRPTIKTFSIPDVVDDVTKYYISTGYGFQIRLAWTGVLQIERTVMYVQALDDTDYAIRDGLEAACIENDVSGNEIRYEIPLYSGNPPVPERPALLDVSATNFKAFLTAQNVTTLYTLTDAGFSAQQVLFSWDSGAQHFRPLIDGIPGDLITTDLLDLSAYFINPAIEVGSIISFYLDNGVDTFYFYPEVMGLPELTPTSTGLAGCEITSDTTVEAITITAPSTFSFYIKADAFPATISGELHVNDIVSGWTGSTITIDIPGYFGGHIYRFVWSPLDNHFVDENDVLILDNILRVTHPYYGPIATVSPYIDTGANIDGFLAGVDDGYYLEIYPEATVNNTIQVDEVSPSEFWQQFHQTAKASMHFAAYVHLQTTPEA